MKTADRGQIHSCCPVNFISTRLCGGIKAIFVSFYSKVVETFFLPYYVPPPPKKNCSVQEVCMGTEHSS